MDLLGSVGNISFTLYGYFMFFDESCWHVYMYKSIFFAHENCIYLIKYIVFFFDFIIYISSFL